MRTAVALLLLIGLSLCLIASPAAQGEATSGTTPEQIVTKLAYAVGQGSSQDVEESVIALQQSGDAAIPAIASGLSEGDDPQRLQLVRALSGIGSDSSTSLLLQVLVDMSFPKAADRALFALENRTISRTLSPHELQALIQRVSRPSIISAGRASRFLARCVGVPAADRLEPIIARFKTELASPSAVSTIRGSYLSPPVYARSQYLLALGNLPEGTSRLRQELQSASANADTAKWWKLALGFAGDASVADDLKNMAATDPDRYVRCAAVTAYARSAKKNAIPFLQSLLADTTESEYAPCTGGKTLLIRDRAKDELFRLEHDIPNLYPN